MLEEPLQLVLGAEVDLDAALPAPTHDPDPRTEHHPQAVLRRPGVDVELRGCLIRPR